MTAGQRLRARKDNKYNNGLMQLVELSVGLEKTILQELDDDITCLFIEIKVPPLITECINPNAVKSILCSESIRLVEISSDVRRAMEQYPQYFTKSGDTMINKLPSCSYLRENELTLFYVADGKFPHLLIESVL